LLKERQRLRKGRFWEQDNYITPVTKTDGLILFVTEKTEGESLVVALDRSSGVERLLGYTKSATPSASRALKFNWLIINQEN